MKLRLYLFAILLAFASPTIAFDESMSARLRSLAEQGNRAAQYHLGMLYNNGIGSVTKDPKKAFAWFQKSAEGNDPLGAYKLGCYFAGQFPGVVAVDEDRAYSYKLIAAKAGYSLAQSDVAIISYKRGDYERAATWWKLAADQGNAIAAYNLANLHGSGRVGPVDHAMAYAYFKLSKLISEKSVSASAQTTLTLLAAKMSPQELERAEQFVASWEEKRSDLTVQAQAPAGAIAALLSGQ
ncbi:sel1 repeat family protein [Massilia sp. RP-1-19]|uniref:Sel1 repeat family protein n=1 Tax=Massilia polaris TaxID=2728846 RepID=A0A848HMX5_9BURK|nr:tetratricopeptide repeat protein [Massilia polaris]NML61489.1 sel1 repeat family protein [Massilia polaris]